MPSRPLAPPSPGPRRHRDVLLAVVIASFSTLLLAILSFLLLLCYLYFSLHRTRARDPTLPLPLDTPFASFLRRFSFHDLRSVIASFDPSPPSAVAPPSSSSAASSPMASLSPSNALTTPPPPSPCPPLPKPPSTASSTTISTSSPPSPLPPSLSPSSATASIAPTAASSSTKYMPNGSLQDALFSSSYHHLVLSWDRRFGIVLDVAQALAFLSWNRWLGSGLGARLARQATQTGMMRGRTRRRTALIQGIRARWRDWTVGRMPFFRNRGSTPPSGSRRRNRRRPSTIEIRRTGR